VGLNQGIKVCSANRPFRNVRAAAGKLFKRPRGRQALYRVPLWAQKNIGKWTLDGGAGETIVPQTQYRNFPFGGFLVKREIIHNKLELGTEVFSLGAEGYATPQIRGSTMLDIGGYYHFKNPDHQFLFAYGHSVGGLTENYAHIGIYWIWGKDKDKDSH
jgi:hypothetical protein